MVAGFQYRYAATSSPQTKIIHTIRRIDNTSITKNEQNTMAEIASILKLIEEIIILNLNFVKELFVDGSCPLS